MGSSEASRSVRSKEEPFRIETIRRGATFLRTSGWVTVAALDPVIDWRAEASRLGCSHVLEGETPVAVVQRASLPDQRHAVTTLGELAATIAREGLASPSVIVVGDVVRGVALASEAVPRARTA